jgi:hypothetical protein
MLTLTTRNLAQTALRLTHSGTAKMGSAAQFLRRYIPNDTEIPEISDDPHLQRKPVPP